MTEPRNDIILDGVKIQWYADRVRAWERGERIAPVTIDLSLLPIDNCLYACTYCYSKRFQRNQGYPITRKHITDFIDDAAEIGVKGVTLCSDGDSAHHPDFAYFCKYATEKGLAVGVASNSLVLKERLLMEVLPHLTFLRVNISAGEPKRYAEIMGVPEDYFHKVCRNISSAMRIKKQLGLKVTIGMQMVTMPQFADQVIPLAELALKLMPCYLVYKHCSDDLEGGLGIDYSDYPDLHPLLKQVEAMSTPQTQISVKWNKLDAGRKRSYKQCYAPPFQLQMSGSGLVAPCGMMFANEFKEWHLGNITQTRLKEIWESNQYWEKMERLASTKFDAPAYCAPLCLQDGCNIALDQHVKGEVSLYGDPGPEPQHIEFL